MMVKDLIKDTIIVIIFGGIILGIVWGGSKQCDYLFQEGNKLYQAGEYNRALEKYNEIVQMNYESAELYYNIGNCYFKLGKYAEAILNYERGLRINPNDEDIQFNLQMVNMHIVDKVQKIPELFYISILKKLCSKLTFNQLTIINVIMYILIIILIIMILFVKGIRLRSSLSVLIWIGGVLIMIFIGLFIYKYIVMYEKEGIVMSPEVMVKSAPDMNAIELFAIHEGLKVNVLVKRGDWYEIKLPDGKEGWVKVNDIEII